LRRPDSPDSDASFAVSGPGLSPAQISAGAVHAAIRVARRLGIGPVDPLVLHASQHVSIRLRPLDVVARVAGTQEAGAAARLRRELAVARHLVARSAPVVPPTAEFPAGPHFHDGYGVTLWRFVAHLAADADNSADVKRAADALRRVHRALADYRGELPSFMVKIAKCRALLQRGSALPALPAADRAFLLAVHDRILAAVDASLVEPVPIHGDAHLGNVFITSDGALWTDFEDACLGPREWDIGSLPEGGRTAFDSANHDLLSALADLRSLCVCVWCWARYDAPERREAAQYHLGYLRERFC
jgi:predicted trehalose synthase